MPQHDQRPLRSRHGRELCIKTWIPIRVSPDPHHTIRGKMHRPIFDLPHVMSGLLEDQSHPMARPPIRSKTSIAECDRQLPADRLIRRNHRSCSRFTAAWLRDDNRRAAWFSIEPSLLCPKNYGTALFTHALTARCFFSDAVRNSQRFSSQGTRCQAASPAPRAYPEISPRQCATRAVSMLGRI